jgi:hypothetical protein
MTAQETVMRARLVRSWLSPQCRVCGAAAGVACDERGDGPDGLVRVDRRPRLVVHSARMADAVAGDADGKAWTVAQFGRRTIPAVLAG